MLLSELVFLAIKNVIYYDDEGFTLESFRNSFIAGTDDYNKWRNSADYGNQINNAITPINEAFARLSDLERLPYELVQVDVNDYKFNLRAIPQDVEAPYKVCKEVVGAGFFCGGRPMDLEYNIAGSYIIFPIVEKGKVWLEYKPDIFVSTEDWWQHDFDLYTHYGITNSMCQFIIEYVEGKLLEQISPNEANMHISRSESYFNNIAVNKQTFTQHNVNVLYKM